MLGHYGGVAWNIGADYRPSPNFHVAADSDCSDNDRPGADQTVISDLGCGPANFANGDILVNPAARSDMRIPGNIDTMQPVR